MLVICLWLFAYTAQRQYLEYVLSVYPHWVEQVALCKEKERIMGRDAPPLCAEITTRLPHPVDHQVRGRGTMDTPRHRDTLSPPLPILPLGAGFAQKQGTTTRLTCCCMPHIFSMREAIGVNAVVGAFGMVWKDDQDVSALNCRSNCGDW